MFQDLARVICLIDVRFDKAASDWITLQEENSSCKFGALQGIKVVRAAAGPTTPDQKTKRTTLRKSSFYQEKCPWICFRLIFFRVTQANTSQLIGCGRLNKNAQKNRTKGTK